MASAPSRHVTGREILDDLNSLYNDIGAGSMVIAPALVERYQWALLHCIAALKAISSDPMPPLPPLRLVKD